MRVMLATIALNEMEWLPKLVEQHRNWPGLVGWVFVEGADPVYKATNPDLVDGWRSTDGTSEFLGELAVDEGIFWYDGIGGWGRQTFPPDQSKCHLRNYYLRRADELKPDIIVQLDADEFYTRHDQERINNICASRIYYGSEGASTQWDSWMFRQRHIWRPSYRITIEEPPLSRFITADSPIQPTIKEHPPLFSQEVVGGYWQVPHTRIWRYVPGMRHVRNHNWPEVNGRYLTEKMLRCDLMEDQSTMPQCVHMGYASSSRSRNAKHDYYKARGEGSEGGRMGRKRSMYVECRDAYERWKPGDELPHGASVIGYNGVIPEVFR